MLSIVSPLDSIAQSPEHLAVQSQTGCRDSFELLVEHFEKRIFNFLLRLVGNPHDAEDIAQETFVSAYQSLARYNPSCGFSTWLFTIAKRCAVNHLRKVRRNELAPTHNDTPQPEAVDLEDPSVVLESKDRNHSIWDLARTLPTKQQEALWLHYGEGFSVAETAQIMGTNQIYVKVLLHRGRTRLGKLLGSNPNHQ